MIKNIMKKPNYLVMFSNTLVETLHNPIKILSNVYIK